MMFQCKSVSVNDEVSSVQGESQQTGLIKYEVVVFGEMKIIREFTG